MVLHKRDQSLASQMFIFFFFKQLNFQQFQVILTGLRSDVVAETINFTGYPPPPKKNYLAGCSKTGSFSAVSREYNLRSGTIREDPAMASTNRLDNFITYRYSQ